MPGKQVKVSLANMNRVMVLICVGLQHQGSVWDSWIALCVLSYTEAGSLSLETVAYCVSAPSVSMAHSSAPAM